MKGLIISPDDQITIKFAIGRLKKGDLVGNINSVELKKIYGDDLECDSVEEHTASFRRPTFGDIVNITGKVSTVDGTGFDFNPLAIRFKRMKSLLKSWTLVDEDKPIPATPESINNLDPVIVSTIGIQLDAALGGI